MLNWRRDPVVEKQIACERRRADEARKRATRLESELALLNWMHSELDLIEADLPSSSTPPPTIAASSSGC